MDFGDFSGDGDLMKHTLSPAETDEVNNLVRWTAHPSRLDVAISNQGHTVIFPIVANRDVFLRANRKQRHAAKSRSRAAVNPTKKSRRYRLCPTLI